MTKGTGQRSNHARCPRRHHLAIKAETDIGPSCSFKERSRAEKIGTKRSITILSPTFTE